MTHVPAGRITPLACPSSASLPLASPQSAGYPWWPSLCAGADLQFPSLPKDTTAPVRTRARSLHLDITTSCTRAVHAVKHAVAVLATAGGAAALSDGALLAAISAGAAVVAAAAGSAKSSSVAKQSLQEAAWAGSLGDVQGDQTRLRRDPGLGCWSCGRAGDDAVQAGCRLPKGPGGAAQLLKCTGCGRAKYCSVECQRKHWKAGHKEECKQLGAAAGKE